MEKTSHQFDKVIQGCREIFAAKMSDYGCSWRVLRPRSLTDQIYIKAQRIRTIEEKGVHLVQEGIRPEFAGIINYCIIAMIQLELGTGEPESLGEPQALVLFDQQAWKAKDLMFNKNHDYDEAWRNMRVSSFTDIILMKLMRIKQIEDNEGMTFVSEGVEANYLDIINYSVFALIMLDESAENENRA